MKTMSDLKVELWDIERVKPYPKNTKLHPDEQIERLSRTISRFGWDQPIVVDKHGVIIKGHGRRLAALKLGLKKVPVCVRRDLSQDEGRRRTHRRQCGDRHAVRHRADAGRAAPAAGGRLKPERR
jgi:hypothetical protein